MKPIRTLMLLFLCVAIGSCGRQQTRHVQQPAAVWSCVLGTQGGFTGGGDGYEIHSDGRVLAWSRLTADAETETQQICQVDHEQLLPVIEALAVRDLYAVELRQSGNLTHSLEVRTSEHPMKSWSWPADRMGGRTPKVPTLVQDVYEAAMDLVRECGGGR